jgi:hypothetical protein
MSHNYSVLDELFVKNLQFNIDLQPLISSNSKMDTVPPALASLILSKSIEQSWAPSNYYNSNIVANELQTVFPFLSEITYNVSLTSHYLDDLKSKNSIKYDKSFFNTFAPIAVRYTNGSNMWLIERPPFQANITYRAAGSNGIGKEVSYSIWMPWTVMFLDVRPEQSFYDAYLYFNDGPISSLDDVAVPCFFPNMYGDGRMCLNQSGVMLQQHLSQTNSFDIATIYNFLINDYMSGGWNLDLSIQNFDRIRNLTQLTKQSYSQIVHGIPNDKKYPSSVSLKTGRVILKKYVSNFLNYFSLSPMNLVLDLVTSVKQQKVRDFKTYAQLIESHEDTASPVNSLLSSYNTGSPSILQSYRLLVSPKFCTREVLHDDPLTDYAKVAKSIIAVLDDHLKNSLQDILTTTDQHKVIQSFQTENPILYIENEDTVFIVDENSSEEFFKQLIGIKETASL